ncbi:hypothetical protein [Commensalibacter oyaizuii]|uniref:Phosphatidate cytidylyltransferase n=1 Tax=Commensalibacter oyaizuii TaxID=3043873 RepID=A0ABT6Q1L6_9PROT|nr:hypothetical protein [Commensalibacter sp. TBRC 16381]MDI2091003.1 hypothetical protein [Commensalibacter sp. TBRC 16381]
MEKSLSVPQLLETSLKIDDVPDEVIQFVESIIVKTKPVGVLYYGSTLWKKDLTGLFDFYIVFESLSDWYKHPSFHKLANKYLPPNIEYHEFSDSLGKLRAKVAILSLQQLRYATGIQSFDTTMWARFCQPVKIIWSRDDYSQQALFRCLIRAVGTAAWWAAYLGPNEGTATDYWCNLFSHTYAAELRVESKNRPSLIIQNREDYFTQLLKSAWQQMGINFYEDNQYLLKLDVNTEIKKQAQRKWWLRVRIGRPLNVARLIKAAFTFQGGAQYIAWKIKRHRGIDIQLTPFQERHPLFSAPWVLLKLYRQGVFKR